MPEPIDAKSPEVCRCVRTPGALYLAWGLCLAPATLQVQAQAVSPADGKLGSVAEEAQPALPARDETACRPAPGEGPEMVVIPVGSFLIGSPSDEPGRESDEGPQREIGVSRPFAIGRCEVTVAEFRLFVEETGHQASADGCIVWSAATRRGDRDPIANWRAPGIRQTEQDPVVCVNWRDVSAYAAWLSQRSGAAYRLPTEAEWEYAARAGSMRSRFWGDDPKAACRYANVYDQVGEKVLDYPWEAHECSDGEAYTAPVGRYDPNGYGLYDLLGNVWEWVGGCYMDSYDGAYMREAPNGQACKRRVVRGGGWGARPALVRSASRHMNESDEAHNFLGFRLARTLP